MPVARPVSSVKSVVTRNSFVSVPTNVSYHVVCRVPTVTRWQSQKKDVRPKSKIKSQIKCVKSASFVGHFVSVPNVPNVASVQPVGNMGSQGCKPKSRVHIKGRLCSSLQSKTSLSKGSPDSKWLCKPHQRLPLASSCTSSDREKGSREGQGSNLTSLFQQTVHCPKAEPQVAANLGSQYSKSVFMRKNIQNGDSRDNPDLSTTRGVGDIARLQRRLLPHSNSLHIPKIPQVPLSEPVVPVSGTSLWPVNSSHGVHWCGQRGQVNGSVTGYKNPPVPR